MATLPIRQRTLIKIITSDLPDNAPRHLKTALDSYDDELKVRGAQPILGLLKDAAAIIETAVFDSTAQDWIQQAVLKAFYQLFENHNLFLRHFPLDPEREDLYGRTIIDEDNAVGATLSKPFEEVARATHSAHSVGLTTDDFLKVVDKMTEFAKVIASIR